MVLNAPDFGSRDGFAPFVSEKDGIEYVYGFGGYACIDAGCLAPLTAGRVVSDKGEQNRVYSITAGQRLQMELPEGVRVVMLNKNLSFYYDSASGKELPETCDGFILFINEGPMDMAVEIVPQ